jgi:cellulose synthase/poly-beta-1,6-N-acetylglucosamine synthase-like glycosyltransferase
MDAQIRAPRTIGVLIASYKRSAPLLACLDSLMEQVHPPYEVIVVLRSNDLETRRVVATLNKELPVRVVLTEMPGTVAARNAGLDACTSDVLAILDDDTKPHPEWLKRVLTCFRNDPSLGGLGGRDRCFDGESFDDRQAEVVGRIQWCGRMIGNHHLGFGDIREVDFLKGANMSFRAEAFKDVRFDRRLKGCGAQPREDTAFSVAVKAAGWKLAYDPAAVVDHYAVCREEDRHYVDVRPLTNESSFREFAYNDILSMWLALKGIRKFAFVVWSVVVGTCVCPGVVQAIRFTPRLGSASWRRFYVAQQGKFEAFRDLIFG